MKNFQSSIGRHFVGHIPVFFAAVFVVHTAMSQVTSVSPARNALNIPPATSIQITFTSPLQTSSFLDTSSFVVTGRTSGRHRGTFTFTNGNTVVTFTPTIAFLRGEVVSVDCTSKLKFSNTAQVAPFMWLFTVSVNTTDGIFTAKRDSATGNLPTSVFISDIDADGDGDIILSDNDLPGVAVCILKNNGNGTFAPKTVYPAGKSATSVFSADLDGDGYPDIAVTNQTDSTVSILRNNGNGTFAANVNYKVGVLPKSVIVGDLDGDGYGDLVVASGNAVSLLKNNGDGTFALLGVYATGNSPSSVYFSDIDNDGDGDLIVANYSSNTVSILKNNGDGTFAAKVDYTTSLNPSSVSAGDINGDGFVDLAVANYSFGKVSIFINKGDGTLNTKVDYPTGNNPNSVFLYDIDGDGDLDLAVTNEYSNTVSILNNSGDGTFAPKVDYATGIRPSSVYISDLDKDGDGDLVVANYSSSTVSIFKNIISTIRASVNGITFPNTAVGDSITRNVYLRNGTETGLTISSMTSSGSLFTASSGSLTIPAGDSIVMAVKFKPASFGTISDTIQVVSNAGTVKIAVSGSSPLPTLTSSKASIAYSATAKGASKKDTVKITNSSINFLTVDSIYTTSSAFSVNRSTGTAGTDTLIISITFTPAAAGNYLDTLYLRNNSAVPLVKIPLSGTSPAPMLSATLPSLAFANQAKGDSATMTMYLRNSSISALTISSIMTSTVTFSATSSSMLVAGRDSTLLSVKFKPAVFGLFKDSVVVASDGGTLKIFLTGGCYLLPGRPDSCWTGSGVWTNNKTITIGWRSPKAGILSIKRAWYSIDTLPKTAQFVRSQVVANNNFVFTMTQNGSHLVYFFLEDTLGNKNSDSTGSVVVKFDDVRPVLYHNNSILDTIVITDSATISTIPAVIVSASDTNGSGVTMIKMKYRRIDESQWSPADSSSSSSLTFTFSQSTFFRGINPVSVDYYFQADDSAGNTAISQIYSFSIRCSPDVVVTSSVTIPSISSYPQGQEVKAYRIISVPYDPADKRPVSFMEQSFGSTSSYGDPYSSWRMERLQDSTWKNYASFKDSSVINPGSAFFIITRDAGKKISLSHVGFVRPDKMLYTGISLRKGWNLVGNPFLVNVPFDKLIFEGGTHLAHYYFSGSGPQGGWENTGPNADTLRVWQGLAVKVDSACILKFNLPGTPTPTPRRESPGRKSIQGTSLADGSMKDWAVQIDAFRDDIDMVCTDAVLGMKSDAQTGFDNNDYFQAPFVGLKNILLCLRGESGPLSRDLRPVSDEGDMWELSVLSGDPGVKADLIFKAIDKIANKEFEAYLIDVSEKRAYDLKRQNRITAITNYEGVKEYQILIGKTSFISRQKKDIDLIPVSPKLYANFPNPFNPETVIRYAVPLNANKARVVLRVFNLLGQEVCTLVNREEYSGYYEVNFDGKGLSSGPYFYRLSIMSESLKYAETHKMILAK